MPSRGYSAVPNLKVKQLTRLFESRQLSPRKIAMGGKEKELRSKGSNTAKATGSKSENEKETGGDLVKAAAPAAEGQGMRMVQQQQQPVVPQPKGAEQARAATGLMKRFLEKGAGAGAADRVQQKRKGEGAEETEREEQSAKRNNCEVDDEADEEELTNDEPAGAGEQTKGRENNRDNELREMLEGFRTGVVSMDKIMESINNTINRRMAEQLKLIRKAATAVYEDRLDPDELYRMDPLQPQALMDQERVRLAQQQRE